MEKEKVYMVCDSHDEKAVNAPTSPCVGVEHGGWCNGRILKEDGTVLGSHHSSSFGWLRQDLKYKIKDNLDRYEIVDLIGQPVPERFKRQAKRTGGSQALQQSTTEGKP